MDPKLLEAMTGEPAEGQQAEPQAGGLELDPDALMGSIQAGIQGAQQAAASGGPSLGEVIGAAMGGPSPGPAKTKDQQMMDAVGMGGGLATGGLKSVFETKDFLFGDTPPEEQSSFRRSIEQLDADMKEASPIIGGLSSGIGQFAVAMIGIGKLGTVAKALPKVGSAVTAGEAAVVGVRGGAVALESGKAALAGAVAFDPHEARLSNLIQDTPLANPITAWLAADPSDSAAWGRVKSAMESIGLDAAIIGSLKVGGTVWKKLKAGDTAGASRTISDFERKRAAEPEAGVEVSEDVDLSVQPSPDAQPEGAVGGTTVAEGGIPYDLEGTRRKIDASKVGNANVDATHNEFSHMGTSEAGMAAGIDVGAPSTKFKEEMDVPTLNDQQLDDIWAKTDEQKSADISAKLNELAAKGWRVEALDGEFRIARYKDNQWVGVGAGADGSTERLLDELTANQFNSSMGRTLKTDDFNAMSAKAWQESRTSKYAAANANDMGKASANTDEIAVEVVDNPTQAMEQAGVGKPQAFKNQVEFKPEESNGLMDELNFSLENAEKDWDTLSTYETWSEALDAGKRVGPDMGNFYQRFRTDNDLINMIDLAVVKKAEDLEAKGFRVKLSDEKLQRQVKAFASLTDSDPAGLMGILQQASEQSKTLTAKMIVLGSLTAKTFQDTSMLAMRLRLGDYSQFGSREAMEQEIARRFSLATTMLKLTNDIRAQGGRTLRANRGKPFDPSLFEGVSKDRFYQLLADSQGNPTKLKHLADPDLYTKLMDTANYLRINSLISGWTTQAINLIGNGYMLGVRPLERILGAAPRAAMGSDAAQSMIRENLKQYAYMGTALWDGFGNAVKAFTQNESVIRPHTSEAYAPQNWQVPGSQAVGQGFFKAWDSVPNIIYNALSVPMLPISMPSRTLGSVDELMKQVIYRSKLMARAHIEGVENALDAGLSGQAATDFTKAFVKEKMDKAFDAQGRGLDPEALREANIATFQQDLLPGTLGKNVQTLLANDKTKLTRLILPFVKTPTNVLRYAWKMTPGLNVLQGEYRAMLNGKMGLEAQHQAVGQMTMGALFMGAAAYIGQDRITGGGPSDPKVRQQLLATGWRPYSIVFTNEDGTKRYVPFNRMDPVALPFGIIADIQDAVHIMEEQGDDHTEIGQAIGALGISLAKQFTSRTYLLSLNQALEALSQPDRKGEAFVGGMAASFIPFSSATRQTSTDPFMRDARSIADKMLAVIPGKSADLPPKYDWLGQPVVNRQGLWTDDNGTIVDREVQRLSLLPEGSVIAAPNPVWNKVDLRDIQMVNGENAYVAYQKLAGRPAPNAKPLRELIANRIRTDAYLRAPDGDVGTKGTKLWMLNQIVNRYREAAGKRVRTDKNVREALMKAQRKVVDHYAHLKQEPTEGQKADLQGILDGFGAGGGN